MSDEPDILEGYPDLLAIAKRQEGVRVELRERDSDIGRLIRFYVGKEFCDGIWCPDKHAEAIGGLSDDLATLLAAVRSLVQQTRDLRAEGGELEYEIWVVRESGIREAFGYHRPDRYDTFAEAADRARELAQGVANWIDPATSVEIVAVRRHVVQTVQAGG